VSAPPDLRARVTAAALGATDEAVAFAAELVRIPTVNPPGDAYADAAKAIGDRLARGGFAVSILPAEGRPEHTPRYPRPNVLGVLEGQSPGPCLHLNGHFDVVPPGDAWSVDPFAGVVRDGRLYGRGACDMKAGIAAAVYAAEAVRRAGVRLRGRLEISGTVDEESGGFAGVAWLCERGYIARGRTDYVIIPEPFGVDRVCVGHRGVWWFEVTTHGRTAHGSMPFLGVSAIDQMASVLEAVRLELKPALEARQTRMPVVPAGSRRATLNVNSVSGGQAGEAVQTPCVADRCSAIFDRRFLPEEGLESARRQMHELLERVRARMPELRYELTDRMVVHPVETPEGSPLVAGLRGAIREVCDREAELVASPGSYDHKHVARIAGVEHCVAYGPGQLELAHQPDEYCDVADIAQATRVLALTMLDLCGVAGG
jgi:succinyl-diaminopimelate desuccinylase